MKKYFLTTALMGTFIAPAFGADKIITNANTCTVDVLGVSDNNATANTIATWTLNEYECGAGQYLLNSDGTLECTECPVGSYCPGGKFTVESENKGANACPTDYTSDAGATGENECYMGCELACVQSVCPTGSVGCTYGSMVSTGNKYYGSNSCGALPRFCPIDYSCKTGYTKISGTINNVIREAVAGQLDANLDYSSCDMTEGTCSAKLTWYYSMPDNSYDSMAVMVFEYRFNNNLESVRNNSIKDVNMDDLGNVFVSMSIIPGDMNIEMEENVSVVYVRPVAVMPNFVPWIVRMGLLEDEMRFEHPDLTEEELDQLIDIELSKIEQEISTTMMLPELPWMAFVLNDEYPYSNTSGGFGNVAVKEALLLSFGNPDFIDTAYGDIPYSDCGKNIINIYWNPDNGGESIQNMCLYDNTVLLPADPVKPGYVFTGWKLVE